MSWTLTLSGAAVGKAGANCNVIFNSISGAALLNSWSDMAESSLSTITRRDWVALSGATTANFKQILSDVVSDIIAMKIINYDMSGYTSRLEATTMLDVLKDNLIQNMTALKQDENKEVMF